MKTLVTFVLDSSGSMSAIEGDTKGGFNTFLDDQRDEEGTASVSLYDFNTNVEQVYRSRPIEEAPKLDDTNYTPGGKTALHDALATAIDETAKQVEERDEASRPNNVIVVVFTDGKENASETPHEAVRERVDRYKEDGWEFLFVGANQDATLTATSMGMDANKSLSMDHSGEGAREAYSSTSDRVSEVRSHGATSGYEESDRKEQDEAGR